MEFLNPVDPNSAAVSAITTGPSALIKPANAITLTAGADIQAIVERAPENAVFWLEAGIYRMQSITPKNGQEFYGQDGAVLNGSRQLTSFAQEGVHWVASGQTQEGERRATDEADDGFVRAGYPESVFFDGEPLIAVASRADVTSGTFYFDYGADKIYLADNPAGHAVEASVAPYAFGGEAANVVIQNLVVEKYASPVQQGAIGAGSAPDGWMIVNNEVRSNFGVGIMVGDGSQVIGNFIHNNGQMGLGGNGDNILVERNEIASNGFFSGIDPYWEGGGTKFADTDGLAIQSNYSHNNNGYGLWTDINNINTVYDGNRVEYNSGGGINHEISYAAVISNNSFVGNGADHNAWLFGSAVQLQNSRDVQVYNNVIDATGAGNAIGLMNQDRGSGTYGAWVAENNTIRDNVIVTSTLNRGISGVVADFGEEDTLSSGNTFDRNHYYVADPDGDHWAWGDQYGWDEYRKVSGQDANSTLTLTSASAISPPPKDAPVSTLMAGAQLQPSIRTVAAVNEAVPANSAPEQLGEASQVPLPTSRVVDEAAPANELPCQPVISTPSASVATALTVPAMSREPVSGEAKPVPAFLIEPFGTYTRDVERSGGQGSDTLVGELRNDTLFGQEGNDLIFGLSGIDFMHGQNGNDTLVGGEGEDHLFGGAGSDTFVVGSDVDIIYGFNSGVDTLVITNGAFSSAELALSSAEQVGLDVWIDMGAGNRVQLEDMTVVQLGVGDFLII